MWQHGRIHHSMNDNIIHFRTTLICYSKISATMCMLVIVHWFQFTKIVLSRKELCTQSLNIISYWE